MPIKTNEHKMVHWWHPFFKLIWNGLAIVGLAAIVGAIFVFLVLQGKTGLGPIDLSKKIVRKGIGYVLPQAVLSTSPPRIAPEQYQPMDLSPHVSTTPLDEAILYNRKVLRVGPTYKLKKPSDAAKIAAAGDIVEIDAGLYVGDAALWRAPKLTIRGVGGRAILESGGAAIQGKAIWLIQADNILIENVGFKNCKVRDRNGAGIRVEADNLRVRNCLFWNNENGILCGSLKNIRTLSVQYSEFGFNGYGDGQSHGIYVGNMDKFIFRFNYVHHTKSGHHVKSRARSNHIEYNYLTDLDDGTASYAIDLPDGGEALVIGNIIHQSKYTENSNMIHYGFPNKEAGQTFYIVNNTVSSNRHTGNFVMNHSPAEGVIVNNLLTGKLDIASGPHREKNNIVVSRSCFSPYPDRPFALAGGCAAIDTGIPMEDKQGVNLIPKYEYVHPLSKKERRIVGKVDIGAYEFVR
jgi:hypothetical protein